MAAKRTGPKKRTSPAPREKPVVREVASRPWAAEAASMSSDAADVIHKWCRGNINPHQQSADALSGALRLADRVTRGFPTRAFEEVLDSGLIDAAAMYEIVIPRRTLAHRKQKKQPLSPEQSDRLARVLRVYSRAEEAIGSMTKASRWLHKENRALEGRRPVDLLGSDAGARAVEKVLGRIEHGIAS